MSNPNPVADLTQPLGKDPHSWSNFESVSTARLDLHLTVDFTKHVVHGHVDLTLSIKKDDVHAALFDTRNLIVEKVTALTTTGEESDVQYALTVMHPKLGTALSVELQKGSKRGDTQTIRVYYSTTPESAALQWFEPEQTTGKKHPYVYTQCEAILARTLVPCMDTPSVKAPYAITLTVPSPLIAVASGTPTAAPTTATDGWLKYKYYQKIEIPSYLIAFAVGALKSQKVGPRSSVWTEEELLEAAVFEYSKHTEQFVSSCEGLFKDLPYEWGTYDLLVLPSAFPYGGMENPQLTFVNSSLLTGDHSLVDVVAHEIAHSWSGNLVTNSTWTDFWLNEGFTMYLERQLLGKVIGGEPYRLFHIYLGLKELTKVVHDLVEAGEGEYTKLRPRLHGIDPDDAFSIVPYEKGCLMLYYLELIVGGSERMLEWLNQMYVKHRKQSISSEIMRENFLSFFSSSTPPVDPEKLKSIDWDTWWYKEGLPSFDFTSHLQNSFSTECDVLIRKWETSSATASPDPHLSTSDLAHLKPSQVMFCLDEVISGPRMPFPHVVLDAMVQRYGLLQGKNVEIVYRFLALCLKSRYPQALPTIEAFLQIHGRGRYIKYLYNLLNEYDHATAVRLWKVNRFRYHAVIKSAFDRKLSE